MSPRNRRVVPAPRAEADLEDIVFQGERRWGEEQALDYAALIDAAVKSLQRFPEMGRLQEDLFAGCRRLPVEHHVIYYRIAGPTVRVVRILHERMNPQGHVTGNE